MIKRFDQGMQFEDKNRRECSVRQKGITIYDIAKEAQVSPATVSRILTGSAGVKLEKKERVLELIEKYDFQPNAHARALTEKRSRMIGMVVAHTGNSYYNSLMSACENEAYRRGYVTIVMDTNSRPEYEVSVLSRMRELRPDAIILSGGRIDLYKQDPAFIDLLKMTQEQVRMIVASRSPSSAIPGVAVDHKKSVDIAVKYLAGMGHRDIGFIYTGKRYYGTRERLEQFKITMNELGLPVRTEALIHARDYNIESGIEAVERILAGGYFPTALLGINDMVSVGVLQGLLAHEIRVPEDVSLLGFDDTYVTEIVQPRLSSVGFDYDVFGKMLMDAALSDGEVPIPENQYVPVFITERKSCAPPRILR